MKTLSARWAFFAGEQHDHKAYDFSGRRRNARGAYILERLDGLGFEPAHPPSMHERAPDCPVPLAKQVIKGFTQMIFPRGTPPTLEVPADPRTERYQTAIFARSHTWTSLMAARTIAGAVGEAAVRVFAVGHLPSSEPIDTREIHVRRWVDQGRHIPAEVVWQCLVEVEEEGEEGLETRRVWRTRVYTETHEYVYEDVAEDYGEKVDPNKTRADGEDETTGWIPLAMDDAGSPKVIEHMSGRCPIVWITNTRTTTSHTGEHDCDGVEKLLDRADFTAAMAVRASNANADPTVAYSDDRQWHQRNAVLEKGHGKMIRTGPTGKVDLLEASGSTVEMEWKTYTQLRNAIMQTTGAVIIDPEVAGAWAQSGRALSILWRPMEAASGEKRVPMEAAIEQLAELWRTIGLGLGVSSTEDDEPVGVVLPPCPLPNKLAQAQGYRLVAEPADEDEETVLCVHQVGVGRHVSVKWPAFHEPQPEQFAQVVQAATVAAGAQPVISQRTGVRMALRAGGLGDDVEAEMHAMHEEAEGRMERAAAMIDGAGGGEPPKGDDDEEEQDGENDAESDDEGEDGEDA